MAENMLGEQTLTSIRLYSKNLWDLSVLAWYRIRLRIWVFVWFFVFPLKKLEGATAKTGSWNILRVIQYHTDNVPAVQGKVWCRWLWFGGSGAGLKCPGWTSLDRPLQSVLHFASLAVYSLILSFSLIIVISLFSSIKLSFISAHEALPFSSDSCSHPTEELRGGAVMWAFVWGYLIFIWELFNALTLILLNMFPTAWLCPSYFHSNLLYNSCLSSNSLAANSSSEVSFHLPACCQAVALTSHQVIPVPPVPVFYEFCVSLSSWHYFAFFCY